MESLTPTTAEELVRTLGAEVLLRIAKRLPIVVLGQTVHQSQANARWFKRMFPGARLRVALPSQEGLRGYHEALFINLDGAIETVLQDEQERLAILQGNTVLNIQAHNLSF